MADNLASQNIFNYATSELSQDAFISLLIAWFDSDKKELKEISKDFISLLYYKYSGKKLKFSESDTIKIIQQHHKIDVYFELVNNEKTIPFIIEDKTWTEPHSGQLLKYVKKVKNRLNISENEIVKIFFKTGHITEKDLSETESTDYKIIDTKCMYDFLKEYEADNIIFKDYKEYLAENFYNNLYENGKKKGLKDWKSGDVYKRYVQYAIIEKIKNDILNSNVENLFLKNNNCIKFRPNGKSCDTWWPFYDNDNFKLFAKIKKIDKCYRIRLIQYEKSGINKDQHLNELNTIINTYLKNNNGCIKITIKPRKKATETEIAHLILSENINLKDSAKEFSNFVYYLLCELKNK
jgi:hypothetical protein